MLKGNRHKTEMFIYVYKIYNNKIIISTFILNKQK